MEWIRNYFPKDEEEMKDRAHLLRLNPELIGQGEEYLHHFTTSSIILNESLDKILFIFHKVYHSWGWPGGHVEAGEDLFTSSLREIHEETGLHYIKPITRSPMGMELQTVGAHEKQHHHVMAHFHVNFTFGYIAHEGDELIPNFSETQGVQWIPIDELKTYVKEEHMLPIYKKYIHRLRRMATAEGLKEEDVQIGDGQ